MFSLTRLDVCSFLFPDTYFDNDSTTKGLNLKLYLGATASLFFCNVKGHIQANRESSSCNHLRAIMRFT